MSDKKICPLFKMAIMISNKANDEPICIENKCQLWYLCSELDPYEIKGAEE